MPKLYLIPTTIGDEGSLGIIPALTADSILPLRVFFVEEEKHARRFLKKLAPPIPLENCEFYPLNEHTASKEVQSYLGILRAKDAGIISESGCPCVADPGSDLVLLAHKNNIEIIPLVGPSSILLALMASGLSGQNFTFNGYLPKEKDARLKKIKELERRSETEHQTQIFMEAPYRNENLLEDILSACAPQTLLCVACDLTAPTKYIKTLPVKEWHKNRPAFDKRPALFLIQKMKD